MTDRNLSDAAEAIRILEAHGFGVLDYGVSEPARFEDGEFALDLTLDVSGRRSNGADVDVDVNILRKGSVQCEMEDFRRQLEKKMEEKPRVSATADTEED